MNSRYDIIVIGAGPAAGASAIAAAARGLRVAMVVPSLEPEPRPGETLHPGVEPLFRALGVIEPVRRAARVRHTGIRVVAGSESHIQAFGSDSAGRWQGFQVRGADLDLVLRRRAQSLGAILLVGRVTEVLTRHSIVRGVRVDGRSIFGEAVIDGTGRRRLLARAQRLRLVRGPRRRIAWCGYCTGRAPELGDEPELELYPAGYTWSARIDAELFVWTAVDECRPRLAQAPARLRHLAPRGKPAAFDVTPLLVEASANDGYLLAGDAACITDPLGSHGVLRAIMTGMLAIDVLSATSGTRGTRERGYREWLTAWFHHEVQELRTFV